MGTVQKTLIGINLLSLVVLVSGITVATTKNHAGATNGYNFTWKQTACRVAVFDANLSTNDGSILAREYYTYLGPAEWTASYTVNDKNITEIWKVKDWKDQTQLIKGINNHTTYSAYIPKSDYNHLNLATIEGESTCTNTPLGFATSLITRFDSNSDRSNTYLTSGISQAQYGMKLDIMHSEENNPPFHNDFEIFITSIPQNWEVSARY